MRNQKLNLIYFLLAQHPGSQRYPDHQRLKVIQVKLVQREVLSSRTLWVYQTAWLSKTCSFGSHSTRLKTKKRERKEHASSYNFRSTENRMPVDAPEFSAAFDP